MPTSNLEHQAAERLQFAPRGKVLLVDEDVKDLDVVVSQGDRHEGPPAPRVEAPTTPTRSPNFPGWR